MTRIITPDLVTWTVGEGGPSRFEVVSLRQVLGAPSVCGFDGLRPVDSARLLGSPSELRLGGSVLQRGMVVRVEVRGERVSCTAHGPLARFAAEPRHRCLPPLSVRQLVMRLAKDNGVAIDAGDLPDGSARAVCQEFETDLQLLRRLAMQHGFLFWESADVLVCRSRLDEVGVIQLARTALVDVPRITYEGRAVGGEARIWCANDGTSPVVHGPIAGASERPVSRCALRMPRTEDVGEAQHFLGRAARSEVGGNCVVQAVVLDPRVVVGAVVALPAGSAVEEPLLVVEAAHELTNRHVVHMIAVPISMAAPAPAPAHPQSVGMALAEVLEVEDPERRGRVRIRRCDTAGDGDTPWAPVVQSAAGANHGSFTLPQVGDLVVVGFLAGDPHRPLITGSLYHGAHPQPGAEEQAGKNLRFLRTPLGTEIRCEQSEDGDSLVVELQGLTLKVRGGSSPRLDIEGKSDVTIAASSLHLEAQDEFVLKARSIQILASDEVEVDGSRILLGR